MSGNGRRFSALLKKDLLFFSRSKASLILILLVPIIIITILGNMFQAGAVTGVSVLVCDYDPGNISTTFIEALVNESLSVKVQSFNPDCAVDGIFALERGQYSAVLVFDERLDESIEAGIGGNILVYIDSARRESATLVRTTVRAITQQVSEQISVSFIGTAWQNLEDLVSELWLARAKLTDTKYLLIVLNGTMTNLSSQLDSMQIESISHDLQDLDSMMSDVSARLDEANQTMRDGLEKISEANETLNSSRKLLFEAQLLLEEDIERTALIFDAVKELNQSVYRVYNFLGCTPTHCPDLYLVMNYTWDITDQLAQRMDSEIEMNASISGIRANLSTMEEDLSNASITLTKGINSSAQVSQQIFQAQSVMESVKEMIEDYSLVREQSNIVLDDALSSINNMTLQINAAGPKLHEIEETLKGLLSKDPQSVVSPLSVSENMRVDVSRFSYMFPAICVAVLMFCCILLASDAIMYEKREGTLLRSFLSPTPLSLFISSKLTALMMVAAVQTAIMIVYARLFFSVSVLLWVPFFLLCLLTALCFVGLGLFIGLLFHNPSTALLTSVLVVVPSLFLSGGLFPAEFMPEGIRLLGSALPLTLGTVALRECAVYGVVTFPTGLVVYTAILCILSLVLLPGQAKKG